MVQGLSEEQSPVARTASGPAGASSEQSEHAAKVVLWVAAIGVGLLHYVLADGGRGPGVFADEVGYLANARYLAGHGVIDMSHTAFYSGGWSLAIVPLSRLFASHPGRLYSAVIDMQALMAVGSVVMIAYLCRWLFSTRWSVAIIGATVAGLYPPFIVNTGLAWSESMLAFTLLVVLTTCVWLIRAGESASPERRTLIIRALVAGAACAYLVTIHRRTLIAMLGVLVVVCGYLLWKRWPGAAGAMFLSFAVLAFAGERMNRHLDNALWGGKGGVDTSGKLSTLLTAHGMKEAVITGAGQSWYQLVGTGGLVIVGVLALVFVALDQKSRVDRRVASALVVAVFALLLAVSVAFLANGHRADQVVYGRYVDIATPLLIAAAIAWIGTSPSAWLLAVAAMGVGVSLLASWILLDRWAGDRLAEPFNRVTTIAIVGWLHGGTPQLLRATFWAAVVGFGALAIAWIVRRSGRPGWVASSAMGALVACLFIWQIGFVHSRILSGLDSGSVHTQAVASAVNALGVPEVALEPSITVVDRLALEFWLPGVKFVAATPAVGSCRDVVSISRLQQATTPAEPLMTVGGMNLFRGQRACPSLG